MYKKLKLPTTFVIFGATGDLAQKKIVPALFQLYQKQLLSKRFEVIGFARRGWSDEAYQEIVKNLVLNATDVLEETAARFSKMFRYHQGHFDNLDAYRALAGQLGQRDSNWRTCANKLYFLSVPPSSYETIARNLARSGLTHPCSHEEGWTRVVIEKPFGTNFASAQKLHKLMARLFHEEQIYRIDHYLGKETVQNILAFRFTNSFLTPSWNKNHIDSISIQLHEKGGVSDRGAYYEPIGALRDVGQNHLLQLLALFTMENPGVFDSRAIRDRRMEVLRALKVMNVHEIKDNTCRGQYRGYANEEGVNQNSKTETYFRIRAKLETRDFSGVPLYLESGKGLSSDNVSVTVTFKHPLPCMCPPNTGSHSRNVLTYHIQPQERITTSFWVKKPGPEMIVEEKDFSFDYRATYPGRDFQDAYEKLLLDAINGNQTLFVSTEEIFASWRFIDPIVSAWDKNKVPLHIYEKGSDGPRAKEIQKAQASEKRKADAKKEIGYIGLGKMGLNMVFRLQAAGWQTHVWNRSREPLDKAARLGALPSGSLEELAKKLETPRLIWIMVSHDAVDAILELLIPYLSKGDSVIDGGNSFFENSKRRAARLKKKGIYFLDAGVSGGPDGAKNGACIMVGGQREIFDRYENLFKDLAVPEGYGYMGRSGAGHFVKMVHNGIEYGMMQALAEGFAVMKESTFRLNITEVANLYNHGSVIESRLVSWLKTAYEQYGENLDAVSGKVSHCGEGLWTVQTAKKIGIPVDIIERALHFREKSQKKPSYTGQILSALRNQFGHHDVLKS